MLSVLCCGGVKKLQQVVDKCQRCGHVSEVQTSMRCVTSYNELWLRVNFAKDSGG